MAPFEFPAKNRNLKERYDPVPLGEGKELLRGLIEKSDVILENFRPAPWKRWASGTEVKKINPELSWSLHIRLRPPGPYRERAAFDILFRL
jgi:crotonobetainyl-CoA:carnitine CoA-transferase CaiB-like acyl-CoA transferase